MGKTNNPRGDNYYTLKAKKEGYPARSVYKLTEINNKFKLIKPESRVLDIGSAPGSWSLYVLKIISQKGFLTAVDLQEMKIDYKKDNYRFIHGDAFSEENIELIGKYGPYSLVLSDAAPSTTGNRSIDTERSFQLVSSVLDTADKLLDEGGSVAIKIFQGGEEKTAMERMKKMFASVKVFKPEAVRKISFETYLIGISRLK